MTHDHHEGVRWEIKVAHSTHVLPASPAARAFLGRLREALPETEAGSA
ncbi:hypothetical protein CU044_6260 [Streptomyces sp. L-9-10]|nr:hypothetical protein CU044_6260 [Streptomyces sp. L-9-10]